jgi:hypothetical protein
MGIRSLTSFQLSVAMMAVIYVFFLPIVGSKSTRTIDTVPPMHRYASNYFAWAESLMKIVVARGTLTIQPTSANGAELGSPSQALFWSRPRLLHAYFG